MKVLVLALSALVLLLGAVVVWMLLQTHSEPPRGGKPETLTYPATGEGCPPGYVPMIDYGQNASSLCFEDRQRCSYCMRQDLVPPDLGGPTYLPAAN